MTVLHFPRIIHPSRGVIHVMPSQHGGYEIAHESASGGSWGSFEGPFVDQIDAIQAARNLNRHQYESVCHVEIWPDLGSAA
jgi:hypothetical protein